MCKDKVWFFLILENFNLLWPIQLFEKRVSAIVLIYSILSNRKQISLFSRKVYDKLITMSGCGPCARWWAIAIFQLTELNVKANPPSFSFSEAALLLVSTMNRDLWPGPTTFRFWSNISKTSKSVSCNISNTSDSVSSGYPNTEKRVENTTRSGVFLTKFEVFG